MPTAPATRITIQPWPVRNDHTALTRAHAAVTRRCDQDGRGKSRSTNMISHPVSVSPAFPPAPAEPPLVQTLRWLVRPVAFLESCRRRYGDAFSVRSLGSQPPLVRISAPGAIQALYTSREHGLPPGRTLTLRPILGARSVLLL